MRKKSKTRPGGISGLIALAVFLLAAAAGARAQAAHYLGSITAISGDTLTVKTDAGDAHQVEVPSTAILKRIAPGEKDLTKAEPLDFASLAVGDRVLVTLDPSFTGTPPHAARIVAIKQADVAQKQAAENAAWTQGVHGLVKSVDATSGVIVVTMRMGLATRDVTVNTTAATVLKRYAPGSVRFDQAQAAPIAAIQPGDQLWARGKKSADGSAIAADGVVSGSFRSIPGTVISIDTAASTLTVKDLATKKPVTVRITADAELRRLNDMVATIIAARLKGNPLGAGGRGAPNGAGGGAGGGGWSGAGSGGQRSAGQGGMGRMDLETVLERAPKIELGALKKGDAVMIVAAEDASGLSAIKLLAGVEPLLEAPEAQNLLSSWSLSSGESEAAQ
jgi:transcription antitermination factor NusG